MEVDYQEIDPKTAYKRESRVNPEFLDTETLLKNFEPLFKSLYRYFCSYNDVFNKREDMEDLYSQIQYEFIRLKDNYDPKRKVDFPGYINFYLRRQIYNYVKKNQKTNNYEKLERGFLSENDEDYRLGIVSSLEDEEAKYNLRYIEALESIPWDCLNEEEVQIVEDVLIDKKSVQDICKARKLKENTVTNIINRVCKKFIQAHTG